MFNSKFIISISLFVLFLVFTSTIKNKTRIIEKKILSIKANILSEKKNINEAQFDFYYLTSPTIIEKKLKTIEFFDYRPISFSKIYFRISDFDNINNKITNLNKLNEEEIKNK